MSETESGSSPNGLVIGMVGGSITDRYPKELPIIVTKGLFMNYWIVCALISVCMLGFIYWVAGD